MKENPIKIKIIKPQVEEVVPEASNSNFEASEFTTAWQKIAKICLYILTGLLPLFFLPITIAPVEINKQMLATILVLVAFLCYLIDSFNRRAIRYPKSLISLGVLIFLILTGLSATLSLAQENAIFGNLIQPDTFLSFIVGGLIFFLAAVYFKKNDLNKLAVYFFAGLVLTAIFGSIQIFGKFILPWNFSRSPAFNSIGSMSSWGIFISFGLVMIVVGLISLEFSKRQKIIVAAAGLLMMFDLFVLNIQMLWVGLALVMLCVMFLRFTQRLEINLPLIIIIVCLLFILLGQRLPSLVNLTTEVRPSISATSSIIKGTFVGVRQILLGSGPASFGFNWRLFRPVALNQTAFWLTTFNQGFSFAATLLITTGILGILAFFFVIFAFIRELFKKLPLKDNNRTIVTTGLSFLLINLFIFPISFSQLFFIFMALGIFVHGSEKNYEINFYVGDKSQKIKGLMSFLLTIFFIALTFFTIYVIGQKYIAAAYYQRGTLDSSLDMAISDLTKAKSFDLRNDVYLRMLSNALSLKVNQIGSTPVSEQTMQSLSGQLQNTIALALNFGTLATQFNPLDSLNWSNLGNVYENLIPISGADTFAEKNYNKVIELDPHNPQGQVDLARMWIVSADKSQERDAGWQEKLNKAESALNKSISLKSDYAAAHFLLAQIYFREGDINATIRKVVDLVNITPNDSGLLFQLGILYYRANQISQAQIAFERAVSLDQNYANARYFLGLIYDAQGQKQKAIEQFKKIQALNPDNNEVKSILDNLRNGKSALSGIVPPAQAPENRIQTPVGSKP